MEKNKIIDLIVEIEQEERVNGKDFKETLSLLYEANKHYTKALTIPVVVKSFPTNDKVFDMAANYIKRNGIIDKPQLRDEVFKAYKYGCYWMKKQLK